MKMSTKPRILLVEDEEPIRTGLTDVFLFNGFYNGFTKHPPDPEYNVNKAEDRVYENEY